FRYGAPYPAGSRFRRAGLTRGVFYASEDVRTAVAEMAFHRLLFFADSPSTPWPTGAGGYTAFSAAVAVHAGLDLTAPPFDRDRAQWSDPTDYAPCQALADAAREAGVELLRYSSARHARGVNLAVMACAAFSAPLPLERQTWHLHIGASGVRAICEFPETRLAFDRQAFAADPRVSRLSWERA
nr:RES family NAD+ phosphorylase [Acidobacteriota bacterium]